MHIYGQKQFTWGKVKGAERKRFELTDKALRRAVFKVLAEHGFEPCRLQTKIVLIPCKDKDCSGCGLQRFCKQVLFKDRIIQVEVAAHACDKGGK